LSAVRVEKRGNPMRDIRDDLQERANVIVGQINAAQGEFDNLIEQIKVEHDSKVQNLKFHLDAIHMVTGIEDRRLRSAVSASKVEPSPRQQPLRQQPPSDFRSRKNGAVGVR
jgi:hypothetical protein